MTWHRRIRQLGAAVLVSAVLYGIAGVALFLAVPVRIPIFSDLALGCMLLLLAWISWHDLKTTRVPNIVTYPLIVAGLFRSLFAHDGGFLIYWIVLFALLYVNSWAGGDLKLLMGLFALFPDFRLAWLIAASILVTGLPYLAFKYRERWRGALRDLAWRIMTGRIVPTREEFEREAVPSAYVFCIGAAAYLLMQRMLT
jgi:Flp pilus assembly protein protease CpaA